MASHETFYYFGTSHGHAVAAEGSRIIFIILILLEDDFCQCVILLILHHRK